MRNNKVGRAVLSRSWRRCADLYKEVGLGGYRPLRSWRGQLLNTTTRTLQPPALMELPRSLTGNAETPSTESHRVRLLEAERNKLRSPRTTTLWHLWHIIGWARLGHLSAGELSRPALPPGIPPGTAGRFSNTDPLARWFSTSASLGLLATVRRDSEIALHRLRSSVARVYLSASVARTTFRTQGYGEGGCCRGSRKPR
jgi:hypothetical protein